MGLIGLSILISKSIHELGEPHEPEERDESEEPKSQESLYSY